MREFTKEEKELIINTPITEDCFLLPPKNCLEGVLGVLFMKRRNQIIKDCEHYRLECKNAKTKLDKKIAFEILVENLPYNSYKVVKL